MRWQLLLPPLPPQALFDTVSCDRASKFKVLYCTVLLKWVICSTAYCTNLLADVLPKNEIQYLFVMGGRELAVNSRHRKTYPAVSKLYLRPSCCA